MSQARNLASIPPRAVFALACLAVATAPRAQLADLQPGRNFTATANFGLNRSADIDAGDVDNDGDLDVVVANGMDNNNEPERIFINQGGVQGGALGTFTEETSTRFAGFPFDKSRDIEFVDFEDDGDLDLFVANDGSNTIGQPSRLDVNLGGSQGGAIGFFVEETDTRWGVLVSIPPDKQILGGNVGPFNGWYFDGDFADLDDDGDSDLVMASIGAAFAGTEPTRIFLNDGTGVFNELWPWADPAADINLHSPDADLCDLDGDFDIDIITASRNSQARVYLNNRVGPLSASPFQDVTQVAYYDTASTSSGIGNYQTEYGDLDGESDFDAWMANWNGNLDVILRNAGAVDGGVAFHEATTLIKDDPNKNEHGADFLDYDGDGDLDAAMANFSGTNWLYQGALAQGFDPITQGLYHRTGIAGGQSPAPEMPTGNPAALTTLDVDTGDIDNDGDDDILVANDGNQQNYLYRNVLGIQDAHAPTFLAVTQQADLAVAAPAVIHAAVRDNHAWYVIARHDTRLVWSVDGGLETTVAMFSQGGQQFRGVIPAVTGLIDYRVECTDRAGNSGVSGTLTYVAGPPSPWIDLGFALSGAGGAPVLSGTGTLVGGSPGSLDLAGAVALAPALLFLALGSAPVEFKGGTLAAFPPIILLPLSTDAAGAIALPWPAWPPAIAPGTVLVFQYAIQDAGAVHGVALSNALQAFTP